MIDHDSMASAFSTLGLDVNRADPVRLLGQRLSDPVRLVLSEVGLPERLSDHVYFDDLANGCVTMNQLIGKPEGSGEWYQDKLFHLGSGLNDQGILLDGMTGEVFALRDGELRRISTRLDTLVEFLYLMQIQMNEADEHGWTSDEDVDRMRQTVFAQMTEVDSQAMTEAGDYWRDMFEYSI